MQRYSQAQQAYDLSQTTLQTDKGLEGEAFSRVTRKLAASVQQRKRNYSAFVSALHENRKLWIHVGSSVADNRNELPQDLRSRLFYLAEFVEQQTKKVLRDGHDVEILLDINASVMRGLCQTGESA